MRKTEPNSIDYFDVYLVVYPFYNTVLNAIIELNIVEKMKTSAQHSYMKQTFTYLFFSILILVFVLRENFNCRINLRNISIERIKEVEKSLDYSPSRNFNYFNKNLKVNRQIPF